MNKFYSIYDAEIDATRHTASKSLAEKIFKNVKTGYMSEINRRTRQTIVTRVLFARKIKICNMREFFNISSWKKEDVKEMACVGLLSTTGMFLAYVIICLAYC